MLALVIFGIGEGLLVHSPIIQHFFDLISGSIGLIKASVDFKLTSKGSIINALKKDPYEFIGILDDFILVKNVTNSSNSFWQLIKQFLGFFKGDNDA